MEQEPVSVKARTVGEVLLESYEYSSGPAEETERHLHREYQICLSFDFPGRYWYRRATHQVPARSVTVIHPGEVHAASDPGPREKTARFAVLYFPASSLRDAAASLGAKGVAEPFFPPVLPPGDFGVFLRLWNVWRLSTSTLERECALAEAVKTAWDGVSLPSPPSTGSARVREAVDRARKYLNLHYAEPVSLAELGEVSGMSAFHLSRHFRLEVGLPPHAYQIRLRIMESKKGILEGKPLVQVADEAGFSDQSHFGRHFHRLCSVSPGTYREPHARFF